MFSTDVLTILLAAGLMISLTVILAAMRRARQRAAADRLSLVLPGAGAGGVTQGAPGETALLRHAGGGRRHEREMREVSEALRHLKIAPGHARVVLTVVEGVSASLCAVLAFSLAQALYHSAGSIWIRLGLGLVGGAFGWCAPMLLAHEAADRRAAAVARGLPDALELLVVCTEAGLSLENGLVRVTDALRPSQPMLAEELALTAADLKVLANLGDGLANLAARVDLPDIRSVVTTLSQSLRYGTPLADSLRTVAAQIRDESMIKLEERGNRLPTMLTLPMMLLIFPTIFLVIVGPAALHALDAFNR